MKATKSIRVVVATTILFAGVSQNAFAASPKVNARCSSAGKTVKVAKTTLICTRFGSKFVWKKVSNATGASVRYGVEALSTEAKKLLQDSTKTTPLYFTGEAATITASPTTPKGELVEGDSGKFTFTGPAPLKETGDQRAGAVALMTSDGRKAYKSQAALPPWSVSFTLKTADPEGRFTVVTSSKADSQLSFWRLAYRYESNEWRYQSAAGTSQNSNGAKSFDVVQLGKPGTYTIQLDLPWNMTFYGISAPAGQVEPDTRYKPSRLRVMIIGDSWTWPVITETEPYHQGDGYPQVLSWLTGWNVMAAGVPGQGYLKEAAGETYGDRVVRDVVPQSPNVVIFTGSPNDHCRECTWTDRQIAARARADITLLLRAAPKTLVILCSPFTISPEQSREYKAVAAALNIPYIDFSALPLFTPENNGQNQLLNGHPTKAGGAYLAKELLKAIAALN